MAKGVGRPNVKKQRTPKPCQVCYGVMRPEGDDFRCDKHGLWSEIEAKRHPPKVVKVNIQVARPVATVRVSPTLTTPRKRVRPKTPWKPRQYTPEQLAERAATKAAYDVKAAEVVRRYKAGERISHIARDFDRLGYKNENSAVVSMYRILRVAGAR